jgi:hypothetical protein
MNELTPEQQFVMEASTMSREQLYNLAKRQAMEIAELKAVTSSEEFVNQVTLKAVERLLEIARKELSHAL